MNRHNRAKAREGDERAADWRRRFAPKRRRATQRESERGEGEHTASEVTGRTLPSTRPHPLLLLFPSLVLPCFRHGIAAAPAIAPPSSRAHPQPRG